MLNEKSEYDIFVASRIGSFKHVKYFTDNSKNNKKLVENCQDVKTLTKDDTITAMCWANEAQDEILIGRRNQQIQSYSTTLGSFTKTIQADFGKGDIVGLGKYNRRTIAGLSSGLVKVWSKKKEREVLLDTGGPLDRLRCCPDEGALFATGGEEHDVKVWRCGEPQPVFAAKNLANDWLQLRQPLWVADLCFLRREQGRLVASCSRHGHVRLYDTRAQRRPVCNVTFEGMAATCLAPSFDDYRVLVGFGRGQLHQVELRGGGRSDKGYKGSVGAICDVAAVGRSLVVSVSLDRHLKVHDYSSKELVYKQYLTSKLSRLLVQTECTTPFKKTNPHTTEVKDEADIKEEDEMDDLFLNMDTVGDKPRKKHQDAKEATKRTIVETTDTSITVEDCDTADAIRELLKSTEKKKRKLVKKKAEKKSKSLFYRA